MNIDILKEKVLAIQNLCSELIEGMNKFKPEAALDFYQLKELLESNEWPEAVQPELICDENNDKEKIDRANGILDVFVDELVESKKVLDFGTGEGHLPYCAVNAGASLAIGYDNKPENFKFQENDKLKLTHDWQVVFSNKPYDVITVFDVMDHLKHETPVNVLLNLKTVLAPKGKIYVRYHPFLSRHGSHLYKKMNKAYMHLVFTEDELKVLLDGYETEKNDNLVLNPIKSYTVYPSMAKLKIEKETFKKSGVEEFFKSDLVSKRIVRNTGTEQLPLKYMDIEFVDHVYSLEG